MKNYLLPLVFAAYALYPAHTAAQSIPGEYPANTAELTKDTLAQLTRFTAKVAEGKTYLHWRVSGQQSDGIYAVYRSLDGEKYVVVGQKKGIGICEPVEIGYYLIDDFSYNGTVYYKLMHVSKEQSYLLSGSIQVPARSKDILTATK